MQKIHGVKRQLTAIYTHQQNSITERKNITIFEMARSTLKVENLSNKFWVEAIAYIVQQGVFLEEPKKRLQVATS